MYKDVEGEVQLNAEIKKLFSNGCVLTDVSILDREAYKRLADGTVAKDVIVKYRLFYKKTE